MIEYSIENKEPLMVFENLVSYIAQNSGKTE